MNIEASSIKNTTQPQNKNKTSNKNNDSSVKFVEELKDLKKSEKETEIIEPEQTAQILQTEEEKQAPSTDIQNIKLKETTLEQPEIKADINILPAEKNLDETLKELNIIVKELNQSDEKPLTSLKDTEKSDDNIEKGEDLINNDFNINEKKEILPQMTPNMNFSGDGQPFSSFMGNENENKSKTSELKATAKELAEEEAILSTMEENIKIAGKTAALQPIIEDAETKPAEKTVNRNEGIKKIDIQSGITIETVVKYDSVIMNEADVEVFSALVEKGEANLNNLAPEAAQKSVHVSKTLADMLAKSKETQQPLRIDFDNGISVIIKISRDGKVSADFLPSTQVAEAYLKENLPILRQRFDEKNLDYDELNQRDRKEQNKQDNRKKGRRDE